MIRPRSYALLMSFACAMACMPSVAQKPAAKAAATPASQSLGAVRPSNLVLPQLGISTFAGGDSAGGIAQIVQNDLQLADVSSKPSNASAAAAAAAKDAQAGAVDYDAWTAAGINYVLKGAFTGDSAQAELYDIASRQRLFGKSYSGFKAGNPREVAHRIADDCMMAMANMPGIFSTQIAYLGQSGGRNKEVFVMDADGANARQLTNEQSIVAAPAWGKNGTEVYFTSYRDNNPDLYGITLGGRRFEVSRRPGLNTAPSWCAATERLAVSLSKDGNSEIYTMSRDGRDLARLTNSPDADTSPEWSPDGSRLAFTSDRTGQPGIYIMSAGGGDARAIATGNYFDSPAWSPDGSKIAYVAREKGEFNIYVADVAGGGPAIQVTRGQRDNTDPSWGPSSRHLVFSSSRGGGKDIYLLNVDTKRAHQISRGGNCTSPVWSPAKP